MGPLKLSQAHQTLLHILMVDSLKKVKGKQLGH